LHATMLNKVLPGSVERAACLGRIHVVCGGLVQYERNWRRHTITNAASEDGYPARSHQVPIRSDELTAGLIDELFIPVRRHLLQPEELVMETPGVVVIEYIF